VQFTGGRTLTASFVEAAGGFIVNDTGAIVPVPGRNGRLAETRQHVVESRSASDTSVSLRSFFEHPWERTI
jgi:hypothetical protein